MPIKSNKCEVYSCIAGLYSGNLTERFTKEMSGTLEGGNHLANIYILVPPEKLVMNIMFQDALQMDNVTMLSNPLGLDNKLKHFLFRMHNSAKLNKFVNLPGKGVWRTVKQSTLLKEDLPQERFFVIVLNPVVKYLSEEIVSALKREHNAVLCLCFLDPTGGKNSIDAMRHLDWFDAVYSFDQEDCKKYGFRSFFQCYSALKTNLYAPIIHDLFFVGWAGKAGRNSSIMDICMAAETNRVKLDFHLVKPTEKPKLYGVQYHNTAVPYAEIVERVRQSCCILDVVQNQQSGASLKYLEAICYNKKLLTNNVNIVNFPYYNERYMRVYQNVSDIDFTWICNSEPVEYGYQNDFSPIHLLNAIISDFEEV